MRSMYGQPLLIQRNKEIYYTDIQIFVLSKQPR
jgi:hypothetical protein